MSPGCYIAERASDVTKRESYWKSCGITDCGCSALIDRLAAGRSWISHAAKGPFKTSLPWECKTLFGGLEGSAASAGGMETAARI